MTQPGPSFGYKHNETTRLNIKANYSEERRLAIGNLNRGKSLSPTIIEGIRQSLNRIKPIYWKEAIQNMKKKKSKLIVVYNMDYTVYGEFASITEASQSLGCSPKNHLPGFTNSKKDTKKTFNC